MMTNGDEWCPFPPKKISHAGRLDLGVQRGRCRRSGSWLLRRLRKNQGKIPVLWMEHWEFTCNSPGKNMEKNEQIGNSLHNYQCFWFFLAHWGKSSILGCFIRKSYGLPHQFHPITSLVKPAPRLLIVRPHTAAFLSRHGCRHGFLPGTASPTSKASLEGLVFRYLAVFLIWCQWLPCVVFIQNMMITHQILRHSISDKPYN